jgi:acetolactate synthase regulatory subunit
VTDAQLAEARFEYSIPYDETVSPTDIVPQADLAGTNLADADLSNADLTNADLSAAEFSETNLQDANLSDADLTNADLTNASLKGADLRGVSLSDVQITPHQLRRAQVGEEVDVPPKREYLDPGLHATTLQVTDYTIENVPDDPIYSQELEKVVESVRDHGFQISNVSYQHTIVTKAFVITEEKRESIDNLVSDLNSIYKSDTVEAITVSGGSNFAGGEFFSIIQTIQIK